MFGIAPVEHKRFQGRVAGLLLCYIYKMEMFGICGFPTTLLLGPGAEQGEANTQLGFRVRGLEG